MDLNSFTGMDRVHIENAMRYVPKEDLPGLLVDALVKLDAINDIIMDYGVSGRYAKDLIYDILRDLY